VAEKKTWNITHNIKITCDAGTRTLSNLVDVLIHENLYEAAFTIILKFWKGSAMKRCFFLIKIRFQFSNVF
jgi:hypothetical protein